MRPNYQYLSVTPVELKTISIQDLDASVAALSSLSQPATRSVRNIVYHKDAERNLVTLLISYTARPAEITLMAEESHYLAVGSVDERGVVVFQKAEFYHGGNTGASWEVTRGYGDICIFRKDFGAVYGTRQSSLDAARLGLWKELGDMHNDLPLTTQALRLLAFFQPARPFENRQKVESPAPRVEKTKQMVIYSAEAERYRCVKPNVENCCGDRCMAWRELENDPDQGVCGLINK